MTNIIIHNSWTEDIQNYFNKYNDISEVLYSENIIYGLCEKSNLEDYLKFQKIDKYCINLSDIYNKLSLISKNKIKSGKITFQIELVTGKKEIIIYFFEKNLSYLNNFLYKISHEFVQNSNQIILLPALKDKMLYNKNLLVFLITECELKKKNNLLIGLFKKNNLKKKRIEKNILKNYYLTEYIN